MATHLSNLITSASLLDQGVLYKYDVGSGTPQQKGWLGIFVAYAASTVGYGTNASVFLEHAALTFSNLSSEDAPLKASISVLDKSSNELEQIKMVAERTLSVCTRHKHNPKIQLVAESLNRITTIELSKREFLALATKPLVVIAEEGAEEAFLNCLRLGDDSLDFQKAKYLRQFSVDVNRMGWSFENVDGSFEEFPIFDSSTGALIEREDSIIERKLKEILHANSDALGPLDEALDVEVQIESKLSRIKQFCHQALGSLIGGSPIPLEHAPASYNEINPNLILAKLFNLRMEQPEDRGYWTVAFKDLNFKISKDLSEIVFSGTWNISLTEAQQQDPVASIKACLKLDFSNDQLILKPAFDAVVSDHATVKDLEDLKLWLC